MKYDPLIRDGEVLDPGVTPGLKHRRVCYERPAE